MEDHIPLTEGEPSEINPITKDTTGSKKDIRHIIKRKQNEKQQNYNKRHKFMSMIQSTQQQIPSEITQLKTLSETIQLPKKLSISVPRKYKTELCRHDCQNRCKHNSDQCLFIHKNELQEKVQRLKKLKEKVQREKERREKERLEKERLEKERLEKERLEKEPLEKEPLEKESLEKESLEKERLEEQIIFLKKQIQHKDKVIQHFMNTIQTLQNT